MNDYYPEMLRNIVVKAVQDVAASLGLKDLPVVEKQGEKQDSDCDKVGIVVFMGTKMSGLCAVYCNAPFIQSTYPIGEKADSLQLRQMDDWQAEICNRVLGAIKLQTLKYKVDFQVSVPVISTEEQIVHDSAKIGPVEVFEFEIEDKYLRLYFSSSLSGEIDFKTSPQSNNVIGGMGEGVVL